MAKTKFENLILYICEKGADDSRLGRVKLCKLLYYSDFGYYRKTGGSISGENYIAIENGPIPEDMGTTRDAMIGSGALAEVAIPIGLSRPMMKPVAKVAPDLSLFASAEIAYVDSVVEKFRSLTGTDLSNLSHTEPGWRATDYRSVIPYATAYFPAFVEISEAERTMTRELSDQYGWASSHAA